MRTYLDHNATTPIRPAAREAMLAALALGGNPSSVHAEGRAARGLVEQARGAVAALVGADPQGLIFTGGGTEANATALVPELVACGADGCSIAPRSLLLAGATEHPCVLQGHRFTASQVGTIPVDRHGLVDLGWLERRLAEPDAEGRALVSVQIANNETGVLQPIAAIVEIARRSGALVHSDAVQAAGKVAIDMGQLGVDLLSLSAHKLGGPQGVGALVLRKGLSIGAPLLRGGGQERGARAGTENVAAIAGFGAAAAEALAALPDEGERLAALRDRLEAGLRAIAPAVAIFGAEAPRLPNTSAFASAGQRAETLLIKLDLAGFAVSSGSACSSGKVRRSHVLDAMEIDPAMSQAALRVSLGWTTCEADIERFLDAYAQAIGRGNAARAA